MSDTVETVEIKKNTDQLNYEDFLGGVTRVVTIAGVERGRKEGQYDIAIEGDDRYWRPPPTVLKQLVLAYGDKAANWIGKRARLYGDPSVKMKGVKVGGIRISHLSHIEKPLTASLTTTRGQSGIFTIDPLPDAPTPPKPDPNLLDTSSPLAKQMYAAIKDSDIPQAEVMVWISNVIGRDVDQTKQMTTDEASQVIAALGGGAA